MTTSIGLNYILQIRNIRKQLQDVWCCRVCLNIFCRWRRIFARLLWMIFDVLIQREIIDIIYGDPCLREGSSIFLNKKWIQKNVTLLLSFAVPWDILHNDSCWKHTQISSKCRSIYCTILPKCNRKWHLQYYIDMTSHKFVCK